ncbi:sodium/proline symporter [Halobacillus karajensis]|uniref:Sodium/proline symporter n=1 Tax=Halobacillus karajensis TaxID=195088 RepID=A0A059NV28_9BACI|nr:sodium/proline symporter [Halobacillus karajensis]CDQ19016.1 Proline permease [Halobacillus karajensis]CDQ22910.1 Proline permease [Halobacillus karajensis]CDQ26392.1 Proline permease [Halobacillus karajensis]SEH42955.1 sodium/proline symporter [Halobacillus karajensis]
MKLDGVIFLVYLLVLLGIGLWFSRNASKSSEHYLLGNRSIGPAVTAMTMQSSSMSGYMFMGGPALAFQQGWYALWYALGDAGGAIINLSVLGKRMRRMSEALSALSPIEYLEKRYESPAVRVIGSVISIIFILAYVFAQFIASGKALTALTGWPYEAALLVGVGVIITYTVAGGYLAVVYTDFIQGIIMVLGVTGIAIMAFSHISLGEVNAQLASIDPTYLSIWGKDLAYYGQWGVVIGAILIYSVGYMGLPHIVVRHMSMKSTKTVKGAIMWAATWNQLFIFIPYLLGLAGIVLLPNLADPEMIIPELAYQFFPGIFAAILLSAIMAAIMSTSDSLLMQAGTILSRDIYQRFIDKRATERRMVWISRICVFAGGVIGCIVAIYQPPSVFTLVIFSFGVLGNSFLVPYVASVYSTKANNMGAIFAMIGGATTNILWTTLELENPTGLHPFLAGLIISFIGMWIGNYFGRTPSPQIQEAVQNAKTRKKLSNPLEKKISQDMASESKVISDFVRKKMYINEGDV